jgi:hypothetical protein
MRQLLQLSHRAMLSQWRDTKYNIARFITIAFMFLFFGLVFRDIKRRDFATVQVPLAFLIPL